MVDPCWDLDIAQVDCGDEGAVVMGWDGIGWVGLCAGYNYLCRSDSVWRDVLEVNQNKKNKKIQRFMARI